MRVQSFEHHGVKEDGTFENEGGAVTVNGGVRRSQPGGGCCIEKCNCSPGYWICHTLPRTKEGVVRGVTIFFDTEEELNNFTNDQLAVVIQETFYE